MAKKVKKKAGVMTKQAAKIVSDAKVQLKNAQKGIDEKIKSNPEEAVVIAAAVGVALGALATYGVLKKKK